MTNSKKENGSYYTPPILSDFIVYHLFDKYKFSDDISILEPSSGDGVFFDSIFSNQLFKTRFNLPKKIKINAIEKDDSAIGISKKKTDGYVTKQRTVRYFNQDYLEYHSKNTQKFDLVIGNPPYIKGQHLTKKQLKRCAAIHKKSDLRSDTIKNIWTSFLVGGVQSLNENGILCFVLPAEILQVIYAKELRDYLKENFKRIEIFAFNELIFPEIEQDVIILFCAKNSQEGVSFYHVDRLDDLKEPTYVEENSNIHRETLDKWTNYILSDAELRFLDDLKRRFSPIKNYCRAEVGIVTAANDYFIVNKETVEKNGLRKLAKSILQKGSHMPPTLRFAKQDFQYMVSEGKPAFFLAFEDKPSAGFSNSIKTYLKQGEKRKINKRYKCKLRTNWYFVPSVWVSEAFFTKRSNIFPRMIINDAKVIVTDSFYRIRMKEDFKVENLVFSFHNTLTLVLAELEGRYYGGSVLELTPNEYKNLSIPYCQSIPKDALTKLDKMFRAGTNVTKILEYTDRVVLKNQSGIKDKEISKLQSIYKKLVKRRLKSHSFNF